MIVTERKKSGDGGKPIDASKEDRPEKKSIGLANLPGVRIESYSSRWGIETGYAKTECRAKTRTADLAARMPVLLLLDDTVQRVDN